MAANIVHGANCIGIKMFHLIAASLYKRRLEFLKVKRDELKKSDIPNLKKLRRIDELIKQAQADYDRIKTFQN